MKWLIIPLLAFTSCQVKYSDTATVAQNTISQQIFSNSVTEFIVRVVYETGATPYTGLLGLTNDTWDITKASYKALFQNHTGRIITIPSTLPGFNSIANQGKTSWTSAELISLGQAQSPPAVVTAGKATVTVIFLNGLYENNSAILGIQFSGYPFAFVFKDVVTSVGGSANEQRYVEQATVVHELGHSVGLVNNGIPLTSNYEDASHPKHSSNSKCVMYWSVESSTSILTLLTGSILGSRLNLFEAETLADGRAYHP